MRLSFARRFSFAPTAQRFGADTPLVLHGASGLPAAMLARAIGAGVCKFNVNTEVRAAARAANLRAASAGDDVLACMEASTAAMADVMEAKMRLFAGE